LIDDTARLRPQVRQLFARIETELRSMLREGERKQGTQLGASSNQVAAALLAQAEGLLSRFVHSGFKDAPTERWRAAWPILAAGAFPEWTATA
jgi:TetR/AcrR family transcriptional regulator